MSLYVNLWFEALKSCLLSFLTYISAVSFFSACLSIQLMISPVFLEYMLEGILPDFFLNSSVFWGHTNSSVNVWSMQLLSPSPVPSLLFMASIQFGYLYLALLLLCFI